MALTPGMIYLSRTIHKALFPPLLVVAVAYIFKTNFGITVPLFIIIPSCIFSLPIALSLSVRWLEFQARREAAAHGAVLAPAVYSNVPFGLDIAKKVKHSFENDFFLNHVFEWIQVYGPTFSTGLFGEKRYFTVEPDHIKSILATDFNNFAKGGVVKFQMQALFGDGVFNADGDVWKFHRGMTRPFFSRDKISHFDIFDRHTDEVLKQIKARRAEGYPIDFQELILRFTLDSATEFLFGNNVRSLAEPLSYPPTSSQSQTKSGLANIFAKEFMLAQFQTVVRGRISTTWPLFEIMEDKVGVHMDAIRSIIQPIIIDALEKKKSHQDSRGEIGAEEVDTLLNHLVNVTQDPQVISDETLNILLAGRDTTATTLTFAIYELSKHPKVVQRLRQEILSIVGPTRRPTYDDIKDMRYLRAFLNEVLRLYPPVAINVRESVHPTLWQSKTGGPPIYVPPKTRVAYSVFVMHRRKDLWGPDATSFDPDRFLDERLNKYLIPNPFIFLPFNGGPRICLGQQFAYNEMSFLVIRLLQQFSSIQLCQKESISNPDELPSEHYKRSCGTDGTDEVRISTHIIIHVAGGLWVKMDSTHGHE
ncbi:cytochrome P450 family protein [Abortiporus biennis]